MIPVEVTELILYRYRCPLFGVRGSIVYSANLIKKHDTYKWKAWQEFEVCHGNEDTFREMLRIKHSIQAQFSAYKSTLCLYIQMLAAACS